MKNNTLNTLNTLNIFFLLLLIFLGAYKTPIGNISITVFILLLASLKFITHIFSQKSLYFIY
ncbi:hypothetical protein PN925_004276, partial [Morganella morganii]